MRSVYRAVHFWIGIADPELAFGDTGSIEPSNTDIASPMANDVLWPREELSAMEIESVRVQDRHKVGGGTRDDAHTRGTL